MINDVEKLIEAAEYYYSKTKEAQSIKVPDNVKIYHYATVIFFSIFETQFNTYLIFPFILIVISHFMVIKGECEERVLARCVSEELNRFEIDPKTCITNEDRENIFDSISEAVSDTGFGYTRTVLIAKSLILGFLVYYATIGILVQLD